ncbi:hypothetical protein M427DRAFT_50501 [Gonapodya prolifera JEL478]|uniref:Cytochrome c oxidase assembly protein COX20, mitochondrial n=1 Tax=Gonapodya prolifera (strain JEL478) TaxID=1344416 RepID=A0A139AZH9_GONPJ|nr:hypothetical protein M427DRAFT_50501 [Gonapodya prolifera JEL478]|eukprot:KXS22142.1 hypothetical protein M427DRAFT_50501 [Gonapodya prolifera JEL478]
MADEDSEPAALMGSSLDEHRDARTSAPPENAIEVLKRINVKDISTVPRLPCSRNALLFGMGSGMAAFLVTWYRRKPFRTVGNWTVGVFLGTSASSWELCRYQRSVIREQFNVDIR